MGKSESQFLHGGVSPWLNPAPLDQKDGLPSFGWRRRMDQNFKEKCRPFTLPRLHQFLDIIMLSLRYIWLWLKTYWSGKRMFIDNWNLCPWRPIYGVPIGGIGAGTIGRGYRGEFCRFQMVPGMYVYETVQADQFTVCIRKKGQTIYQKVLSPFHARTEALSGWEWGFDASQAWYHGLYPRAWSLYEIPEHKLRLICRQISPVIPHNYKDSSLPSAVFVWTVDNQGKEELDVSIMFTFSSGQGERKDQQASVWTEPFSHVDGDADEVSGVLIHQKFNEMPCRFAVAARHKPDVVVSHCTNFDPRSPAYEIWEDLKEDGKLQTSWDSYKPSQVGEIGVAVCVQCKVKSGKQQSMELSLSWDMPIIHFGSRKKQYCRRYTKFYGCHGCSEKLSSYALHQYPEWEKAIDDWQGPILQCNNLPAWYKSALFNELYFVSDGGTQWLHPVGSDVEQANEPVSQVVKEYGKFIYLEGVPNVCSSSV